MDHGCEALIGFLGAQRDGLELLELAEEILDQVTPFIISSSMASGCAGRGQADFPNIRCEVGSAYDDLATRYGVSTGRGVISTLPRLPEELGCRAHGKDGPPFHSTLGWRSREILLDTRAGCTTQRMWCERTSLRASGSGATAREVNKSRLYRHRPVDRRPSSHVPDVVHLPALSSREPESKARTRPARRQRCHKPLRARRALTFWTMAIAA